MNRTVRRLLPALSAALLLVSAGATAAYAQGTAFTYQGELKNSGNLVNIPVDFQFSVWTAPTGGTQFAAPVVLTNVNVDQGRFTVPIDFGVNPFTSSQNIWLQTAVSVPAGSENYLPMGTRQLLTPAPFSLATRGINVDNLNRVTLNPTGPGGQNDQSFTVNAANGGMLQTLAVSNGGVQNRMETTLDASGSGNPGGGFIRMHTPGVGYGPLTLNETMTLVSGRNTGNVGIGTNTPNYKLEVAGTGQFSSDSGHALRSIRSDGTGVGIATTGFATYIESLTEKTLALNASPTVNGASIWISPTGNFVGFSNGNSNPTEVVDVKGNIKIRSDDRFYFGAPGEGTDSMYFQRSNASFNNSTLRLIIGDDPAGSFDTFDIARDGNVTLFSFQSTGNAFKPGGGSWSALCDERSKDNVQPLVGTLDRLLQLKGHSYTYKSEFVTNGRALPGTQVGLVAQEVESVFPDWVSTGADGLKVVTERSTTALMVEALRDLRNEKDVQLASVKADNEALKARLERLEALLASQRAK